MTSSEEIQLVDLDLDPPELLRHLVKDRFHGKTVVTASLMASSVVVLKMIADIDPTTPIIFCHRPPVFQESADYRAKVVEKLGLQNVSMNDGHESDVGAGDQDHCERMWVHHRELPGRTFELLHLNEALAPFDCWISAVYHMPRSGTARDRVDMDGRLVKVDPLSGWNDEDVRGFMRENKLPFHKMAKRKTVVEAPQDLESYPTYHF